MRSASTAPRRAAYASRTWARASGTCLSRTWSGLQRQARRGWRRAGREERRTRGSEERESTVYGTRPHPSSSLAPSRAPSLPLSLPLSLSLSLSLTPPYSFAAPNPTVGMRYPVMSSTWSRKGVRCSTVVAYPLREMSDMPTAPPMVQPRQARGPEVHLNRKPVLAAAMIGFRESSLSRRYWLVRSVEAKSRASTPRLLPNIGARLAQALTTAFVRSLLVGRSRPFRSPSKMPTVIPDATPVM
mmetsp:Transcript_58917/g.138534  ORF Transcript_58917/g.138534 Transcript_58917/m.138534 type:complete len:243 (-) Transcript_58917:302-1030(-)